MWVQQFSYEDVPDRKECLRTPLLAVDAMIMVSASLPANTLPAKIADGADSRARANSF